MSLGWDWGGSAPFLCISCLVILRPMTGSLFELLVLSWQASLPNAPCEFCVTAVFFSCLLHPNDISTLYHAYLTCTLLVTVPSRLSKLDSSFLHEFLCATSLAKCLNMTLLIVQEKLNRRTFCSPFPI